MSHLSPGESGSTVNFNLHGSHKYFHYSKSLPGKVSFVTI